MSRNNTKCKATNAGFEAKWQFVVSFESLFSHFLRYEDAKLSGITVRHKLKYKGVGVDRKVEANFGVDPEHWGRGGASGDDQKVGET
jgi:hypothetical protein